MRADRMLAQHNCEKVGTNMITFLEEQERGGDFDGEQERLLDFSRISTGSLGSSRDLLLLLILSRRSP